jgi:hypothetical protein
MDTNVTLVPRSGGSVSPQYDDPVFHRAFQEGHKAIAFIQLGLLGKCGEWHAFPEKNLISAPTFVRWYKDAFRSTKLHIRFISQTSIQSGMGLYDDSFVEATLRNVSWFFWPGPESFAPAK